MGTRAVLAKIEPEVVDELRACEAKIEQAQNDAWHALRRIHDGKLYKADSYKSFELYCEQRWGYSKTHAYRLIDYSKMVDYFKAEGIASLPQGEGVARPIMKLRRISKSEDDFHQRAAVAWRQAVDSAPKVFDSPSVTIGHVETSMQHFGSYRTVKKSGESTVVAELRNALTKLGQCDALQKFSPKEFVKKHSDKGFPSNFKQIVSWLKVAADEV